MKHYLISFYTHLLQNVQLFKTMLSSKIEERSNALLSLFLFIFLSYNFDETIFNIILYTLVTKCTVILNFNFSHTIYPQLCIVPL